MCQQHGLRDGARRSPRDRLAVDPVPPDVTLTDHLDVWVDERRLELRHFGRRAHTDNDVVVWVPDERVLFTGDLVMHGSMPLVMNGSVRGILQTLRDLLALEPAVVVPGHGDVGGIELLHEQIAELDDPGVADMDMARVLGDMVAFNGGPLRCVT